MKIIYEDNIIKRNGNYFEVSCDGKKYFCKKTNRAMKYNEFIAEEIASDYGILHAHYEMGRYNNEDIIMSEAVYGEDEIMYSLDDLCYMYNESIDCNFMDIWYFFEKHFPNNVVDVMDQLINMFLYDVLIGNGDRHLGNISVIYNKTLDSIRLAPLFDNEMIGERMAIYYGLYDLKIDREDNEVNGLYEFLSSSDNMYVKLVEDKLKIISNGNLDNIFIRLSNKGIKVPSVTCDIIKSVLNTNRRNIIKVLESVKNQKRLLCRA